MNPQRFLSGECVQAYLPLDAAQEQEFRKLVATEKYQGVQAVNTTWYEKGLEKGLETGLEKGRRETLRELLECRFGQLPAPVLERLERMSSAELTTLGQSILRAQSLRELGFENP